MADFSFVSGQVRAQESRLLKPGHLDRMIGAQTQEEAFRVLCELNYAEYIDEGVTVRDFHRIIQQGLKETQSMIKKGIGEDSGMRFLWMQFDINNLKRALKEKLIQGVDSISDFTETNGYSDLGTLSVSSLESIVFQNRASQGIPLHIFQVVQDAPALYEAEGLLAVEYALDRALGEYFWHLREKMNDPFFSKLVRHHLDRVNMRNLARSVIVKGQKPPRACWVEGGNINYFEAEKIKDFNDLVAYIGRTKFNGMVDKLDKADPNGSLYEIERFLDHFYMDFLKWESVGANPSLVIPLNYFEQRLQNARMLKFVMYAKMNGMDQDMIYKKLEHIS